MKREWFNAKRSLVGWSCFLGGTSTLKKTTSRLGGSSICLGIFGASGALSVSVGITFTYCLGALLHWYPLPSLLPYCILVIIVFIGIHFHHYPPALSPLKSNNFNEKHPLFSGNHRNISTNVLPKNPPINILILFHLHFGFYSSLISNSLPQ